MKYSEKDHTFAICAYKESPYLEACIQSLLNQSVRTRTIVVTSTDNDYIRNMAKKYDLTYFVNRGETGITQDWNYAYKCADSELVTIAHQDDIYEKDYAKTIIDAASAAKRPLIVFTGYGELRNDTTVYDNKLLKIKKLMLSPLKLKVFQNSIFIRRRILSLGCPICCPAVTFVKMNLPKTVFQAGFRSDEDWEAWEKLSRLKGAFVYRKAPLVLHRIHDESETSAIIGETGRAHEDYQMFCKFWPKPVARLITKFYSASEKSNELENK